MKHVCSDSGIEFESKNPVYEVFKIMVDFVYSVAHTDKFDKCSVDDIKLAASNLLNDVDLECHQDDTIAH